jgi:ferric iron reductase protein FhuF
VALPHEHCSGGRALTGAGQLGPFFRVHARSEPGWTSWATLCGDPGVLDRRAAEVEEALAAHTGLPAIAPAVVASVTHLGLVARLLAPILGAAALHDVLPVAPPGQIRMHLRGTNPLPMALDAVSAVTPATPADLATALHRHWLAPAVEPLTCAVRASWSVSPRVLSGNVTSAVAGALRMVSTARPDSTPRAAALLDALLDGPLTGTGGRREDGSFQRRSCCLFYRLPGAGTCSDCVLVGRR